MRARVALIVLLLPLLSWTPDFNRSDWLVRLMSQRCSSIRIVPRDMGMSVLCDGPRVEAFRGSTTSGLPFAVRATRAWSALSQRRESFSPTVTVYVGGDFVVIEAEQCPTCNVQRGPAWVFRPQNVRPSTMRAIQVQAGLGPSPLRLTMDAWRTR
jgi:hypothetical protein